MDLYYICPLAVYFEHHEMFMESHFVFTDEEKKCSELIFLCARFHHKSAEQRWREIPGVEPLPYPMDPTCISRRHADILKHHGVTVWHRTIDAAEAAAKLHVSMRFSPV